MRILQIPIAVNLAGSRLAETGAKHKKYTKQGQALQAIVKETARSNDMIARKPPAGFSNNAAASAFPEIGLLTLMSDRSRPAPSVAQPCWSRPVKEGLLLKVEQIIGDKIPNTFLIQL